MCCTAKILSCGLRQLTRMKILLATFDYFLTKALHCTYNDKHSQTANNGVNVARAISSSRFRTFASNFAQLQLNQLGFIDISMDAFECETCDTWRVRQRLHTQTKIILMPWPWVRQCGQEISATSASRTGAVASTRAHQAVSRATSCRFPSGRC